MPPSRVPQSTASDTISRHKCLKNPEQHICQFVCLFRLDGPTHDAGLRYQRLASSSSIPDKLYLLLTCGSGRFLGVGALAVLHTGSTA
jgi:hypothetical protein